MPIHQPQQRTDVRSDRDGRAAGRGRPRGALPAPGTARLRRPASGARSAPPVLTAHAVVQRPARRREQDAELAPSGPVPPDRRSGGRGARTGGHLGGPWPSGAVYGWVRSGCCGRRWPTSGGPAGGPGGFRRRPRCVRPCRWCGGCGSSLGRAGSTNWPLDRALSAVDGPVRAAFALHLLEGLDESGARELLAGAGAADPAGAVRRAARLGESGPGRGAGDAQVRRVRPVHGPDPPERPAAAPAPGCGRRRWAAVLCVVAGGLAVAVEEGTRAGGEGRTPAGVFAPVLDPAELMRTAAERWADTSRVDFTAWPARAGARTTTGCWAGRCGPGRGRRSRSGVRDARHVHGARARSRPGCCSRVRSTGRRWWCSTTAGSGSCGTRSRCRGPAGRRSSSPGPTTRT